MKKYILLCISLLSTHTNSHDFMALPLIDKAATGLVFLYGLQLGGCALVYSCQSWMDALKWHKHNDDCEYCERRKQYNEYMGYDEGDCNISSEHVTQLRNTVKKDIGKIALTSIAAVVFLRAAQLLTKS